MVSENSPIFHFVQEENSIVLDAEDEITPIKNLKKPKEVYASTLPYPRNGKILKTKCYCNDVTEVYDCMELDKAQNRLIAYGISDARKEGYDAFINIKFDYVPIYIKNSVPKLCRVVITGDFVIVTN